MSIVEDVRGTRDRILAAATRRLSEFGYHGTGVTDVMSESNTVAGSLYHHFPGGKEELAGEAVRSYGEQANAALDRLFDRFGAAHAIGAYYAATEQRLKTSDFADGCPVGTPASDGVATETIRAAAAVAFTSWEKTIARHLIRDGWTSASARATASCIVSLYEGAILLSRAERDLRPLRAAAAHSRALVANHPERPSARVVVAR